MLKNYLTLALRTLWRDKGYAGINIVGLSVGIACSVLIFLFVRSEWSYDRFHTHADRLHRAWVREAYDGGQTYFNSVTPLPLGPTLAATYPEVEAFTRVVAFENLVQYEDDRFMESIRLVDRHFFDLFDFEGIAGDPRTALSGQNGAVLTEDAASRIFGTPEVIGNTVSIRVGDEAFEAFVVQAVVANPPATSSIQFDVLLPFEVGDGRIWPPRAHQAWFNVVPETYILLRPGVDAASLEAKFPAMIASALGDQVSPGQYTIGLQSMTDIHLNPAIPQGIALVSDPGYSYLLAAIASLILVIACINFTILAIGRSAGRATEVGIRKAVGASRPQLMRQFWGETLVLTALTLIGGFGLASLALPLFNELAGQQLTLTLDGTIVMAALALFLGVGLLSGAYPAFVMSDYRPIQVLKGAVIAGRRGSWLRRSLIAVQFVVSIALIAGTLVIRSQLDYIRNRDLGFEREQVVIVDTGVSPEQGLPIVERLRNELAGDPGVAAVGSARFVMGGGSWLRAGYRANDGSFREFNLNVVDPAYVEAMGMEMVAGRNFSDEIPSDHQQGIIVNEAFVAAYGWTDPLNAQLSGDFGPHRIVGVVRDFNYASLHTEVMPLALVQDPTAILQGVSDQNAGQSDSPKLAIRLRAGEVRDAIGRLEAAWKAVAPEQEFAYTFLDQALESQYRQEQELGRMVGMASGLAVFIACLGLFGLATLTVARRTKEIGIRKVLGASSPHLVMLIASEFVILIGFAFLIATPAAWVAMQRWLDGFAYRIDLSLALFVGAGVLVLLVALATVSLQAIRAALADPVDSLRYE
ncbi:MAG: ABC transporter permease [Rhodothermales bacterium]|nr:ABC transporter permease [Rhodothermales bacterium]